MNSHEAIEQRLAVGAALNRVAETRDGVDEISRQQYEQSLMELIDLLSKGVIDIGELDKLQK